MAKMPKFFDAFKMATCEVCGREVVFNGLEFHLNEHGIYEEETFVIEDDDGEE